MQTTATAPETTKTNTESKHYTLVYPKEFTQKPDSKKDVGKIHNTFKRTPLHKSLTLREIVKEFCSGKTLMLSMVERDLRNPNDTYKAASLDPATSEWANLHTLNFKSTTLIGIDIDDEYSETNINEVLEHFNGKVSAAYYSFSHGKPNDRGGTQNRYRLLFQLDKPITDYEIAKQIVIVLRNELLNLYPNFDENKIDTMQPKTLWHGTRSEPILINETVFISTEQYTQKAEVLLTEKRAAQQRKMKLNKKTFRESQDNPVVFEELIDMAETIGHIPTNAGLYEDWFKLSMSIRSHEVTGHITTAEGLELFNIISGGESNENDYFRMFSPNGQISIGTFIKYAQEKGYKRKNKYLYALQETRELIETEVIKVDRYIPTQLAIELLKREQRLIVDSPTGSGKTTAIMNGFKEMATPEYNYFIFAVPTIALSEQIAKEHEVTCIKGGIKAFQNMITNKAIAGERIFVSTFDKTSDIVKALNENIDYTGDRQPPKYYIVVDEIHKYTEAYNYRFAAIDKLKDLSEVATSLIGLSGTTEDILKEGYDKLIKINNGVKSSPNTDYRVFTYDTNENGIITPENEDLMLIPVIRSVLTQSRLLLFINNKKRIQRISKLIKGEGITVQTITSDERQSETYSNIVAKQTIESNVQVVICTTVLADGVTISNELDWSCVVVSDRSSPIFNPSTIKQISNRFRNQYRYFALYMRSPNPDYKETRRFNIESDYRYRLRTTQQHVEYLNNEYEGDFLKDFIPSTIEKYNGIYYQSTEEDSKIDYNPLFIRHRSMRAKENYYKAYRNAFIEEVGRVIGRKSSGIFNVNEEIKKNGSDLTSLLMQMQEEKEREKLDSDKRRNNFTIYFTEEIYESILNGDDNQAIANFKERIHPDQYAATLRNARLTDYETCLHLGQTVQNRTDTNKYYNDIQALTDIASFDYVKKITVTEKVFNELMKLEGETYISSDFKEITEEVLPKKLKISKKEIKEGLKLFHQYKHRNKKERLTTIKPLNMEIVSKTRHINKSKLMLDNGEINQNAGIPPDKIEKSILRYIETRSVQQQKILYAAVLKKWGIQWQKISQKG